MCEILRETHGDRHLDLNIDPESDERGFGELDHRASADLGSYRYTAVMDARYRGGVTLRGSSGCRTGWHQVRLAANHLHRLWLLRYDEYVRFPNVSVFTVKHDNRNDFSIYTPGTGSSYSDRGRLNRIAVREQRHWDDVVDDCPFIITQFARGSWTTARPLHNAANMFARFAQILCA